jgi:hypothetical protein
VSSAEEKRLDTSGFFSGSSSCLRFPDGLTFESAAPEALLSEGPLAEALLSDPLALLGGFGLTEALLSVPKALLLGFFPEALLSDPPALLGGFKEEEALLSPPEALLSGFLRSSSGASVGAASVDRFFDLLFLIF